MRRISDTTETASDVRDRVLQAMTLDQRAELVVGAMNDGRALTMSGVRLRHPDYSDDEVEYAVRRLLVGNELADRVWPAHRHLRP